MRSLLSLLPLLLLAACADRGAAPAPAPGRPVVQAVNEPLRCFAARIGGEAVQAELLAPRDVDPAYWEPTDEQIAAFQRADLVLLNGAGYARWAERATLPRERCADTSAAFAERLVELEAARTHSHGPEGAHSHAGLAATTWLDLEQARLQAAAVRDALVALLPAERAALEARFEALDAELRALDAALAAAAPREPAIASHPVYTYWARRYGVDLRSVHFEPDEPPDEAGWAELDALLAERPAAVMVWEAAPLPEIREEVERRGLRVLVLEPFGNRPAEGDFVSALRAQLAR